MLHFVFTEAKTRHDSLNNPSIKEQMNLVGRNIFLLKQEIALHGLKKEDNLHHYYLIIFFVNTRMCFP